MPASLRRGFTLIELVIAAFVFAVGVLALEAMAASSLRRMRRSAQLTLAASVARSRLEKLGAGRCVGLANGSDTVRGIVSSWALEATPNPAIRGVLQTVMYRLDGGERADTYRAMILCSE